MVMVIAIHQRIIAFEDKNMLSGKYSYRLKQIDNDGQFEYSSVVEVDLGSQLNLS